MTVAIELLLLCYKGPHAERAEEVGYVYMDLFFLFLPVLGYGEMSELGNLNPVPIAIGVGGLKDLVG